jgi:hypothetical protein
MTSLPMKSCEGGVPCHALMLHGARGTFFLGGVALFFLAVPLRPYQRRVTNQQIYLLTTI